MLEVIIEFNIALFLAILSPGAAFIFIMNYSFNRGLAAVISAGAGLATMAAVWSLLSLLGVSEYLANDARLLAVVSLCGGSYLTHLAFRIFQNRNAGLALGGDTAESFERNSFIAGFLLNLGNPKSILFAVSIILAVTGGDIAPWMVIVLPLNQLLLEFIMYGGIAIFLTRDRVKRIFIGIKPKIDLVLAVVLMTLGLGLIFDSYQIL